MARGRNGILYFMLMLKNETQIDHFLFHLTRMYNVYFINFINKKKKKFKSEIFSKCYTSTNLYFICFFF